MVSILHLCSHVLRHPASSHGVGRRPEAGRTPLRIDAQSRVDDYQQKYMELLERIGNFDSYLNL